MYYVSECHYARVIRGLTFTLSAIEVGVYRIQVLLFALSVVLYAVHVVPSVVFSHTQLALAVVVSVSSNPHVFTSRIFIRSGGTVEPNAVLK